MKSGTRLMDVRVHSWSLQLCNAEWKVTMPFSLDTSVTDLTGNGWR